MKSIYYEDCWAVLQQQKEGGIAEKYQYSDSTCKVNYSFIVRKAGIIDGVQYYDILTPRGMGGPRCVNADKIDLERYDFDFRRFCKEKNIIAEYVRFDPWNCNHRIFGIFYDKLECYGNLYCNHLNEEFYKTEYNKGVRGVIKKNIDKIEMEYDFEGKNIESFLELYKYTEDKYAVSNYYHLSKEFLLEYFKMLKGKVAIVNALYMGNVASSAIFLFGKDIIHYHFSGNDPSYRSLNANTVLLYQTSLLAKKMEKKIVDLGGGVIGGNTAEYKKHFVGTKGIYPYYVGKRILNREVYQKLVEKNGINKPGYFPEYKRVYLE